MKLKLKDELVLEIYIRDEVGVFAAFELGGLGASMVAFGGTAIACPIM
jgi:hypothetical protein